MNPEIVKLLEKARAEAVASRTPLCISIVDAATAVCMALDDILCLLTDPEGDTDDNEQDDIDDGTTDGPILPFAGADDTNTDPVATDPTSGPPTVPEPAVAAGD